MVAKKQTSLDPVGPIDPDEYNKVIRSASLVTIQLLSSDFSVKPEFYDRSLARNLGFDRDVATIEYDVETGAVSGLFKFSIFAKAGRTTILKGNATYFVLYRASQPVASEAAKAFCRRTGMFASYPYFRSLMAQLCWSANAELPPLPMIASTPMDLQPKVSSPTT